MPVTVTLEAQGPVEQLDPEALALAAAALEPEAPEIPAPPSSRKSVLALAVCALAINGAAAIYTLPSDLSSRAVDRVVDLLAPREAPAPKPDPVMAALKEIQSAQQQHMAALQENNQVLQQSAAREQQDSMVLLSLRQSITDERFDVKKISSQLSTLMAKVDSLQSATMSDVTSSVRKANARYGLSAAMRKRMVVRQPKPLAPVEPLGPVSVGGAPLSMPATVAAPES